MNQPIKILMWFSCPVCGKHFLSYVYGYFLLHCHDSNEYDCFYDMKLKEIHKNSILNTIKNIRKCRKCRKSHQLEEFIKV